MTYNAPNHDDNEGAFAAGSLRGGERRLNAVSLEVTSKSSEWLAVTNR